MDLRTANQIAAFDIHGSEGCCQKSVPEAVIWNWREAERYLPGTRLYLCEYKVSVLSLTLANDVDAWNKYYDEWLPSVLKRETF